MTVQPLIYREETPHGLRIQATCIPPHVKGSWSLKDLYQPEDADNNPELVAAVRQELAMYGTQRVYAPSVAAMSGAVVGRNSLSTRIDLGEGFVLYRDRELPADGVPLDPEARDSFMMSGAGCPVIVAYASKHVVVAHASRDSLFDRKLVTDDVRTREHEGIVHAMVDYLRLQGASMNEIYMRVLFTIQPRVFTHSFTDRSHGPNNRKIYEYLQRTYPRIRIMKEGSGCLSIPAFVSAQAQSLGIPVRNMDSCCLLPLRGEFAHTRKGNPNDRNLVIVRVSAL